MRYRAAKRRILANRDRKRGGDATAGRVAPRGTEVGAAIEIGPEAGADIVDRDGRPPTDVTLGMTQLFSVVVPTYNVASYLGDFLDSLARQTHPLDSIELIFVDDGSTDTSAEMISSWISSAAPAARLLRKSNGGLSSARNFGLDQATGRWVTFCDPDDILSANYFASVATFLGRHEADDLHLLACRLVMLDERTGIVRDRHPLKFRFGRRDRVVDLSRHPRHIHLSAATGFYRTDLIERRRLRFDGRIQPNFEDGHFTGRYLAEHERPRVAFLSDPVYQYRRRRDSSSLVQSSWTNPAKFTEVLRHGYLDLLAQVAAEHGAAPVWLQNLVLYDLLAYFGQEESEHSALGGVHDDVAREFHELLVEIMAHIDVATIDSYSIPGSSTDMRNALLIDGKGARHRPDGARIAEVDADQHLAQVRYYYGGAAPTDEFRVGGVVTEPAYGKRRAVRYLGRQMASERIAWLPADGAIEVVVDGRRLPILHGEPSGVISETWQETSVRALRRRAGGVRRRVRHAALVGRAVATRGRRRLVGMAASTTPEARYRDAWVFTDRNDLAQDNAEHLYRFVKEHHPEINAWFVIDRETTDWPRLEREGFRLVQYGTAEHVLLMINCVELISSHVDDSAVNPLNIGRFGKRRRRFTYVQHGVTKDDASRRLNRQRIDRLITATEAEHRSIAGDGTPYILTDKEVRLTGLPRHDRLLRLSEAPHVRAADPLLLVMPTWRRQLVGDARRPGGAHVAHPGFFESPYATNWLELLRAERLSELARRAGLSIAFAPHPHSIEFLTRPLPDHVEAYRYQDADIQELIARGVVMITDYSSNAFELAYLNRPVIYFQFDPEDFYSGQHVYRRGDWNYETDGFGPVVAHQSQVLDELALLIDRELKPGEPYAGRMAQAFAFRDGKCCARVFESIRSMRHPPLADR